jgi:pimeloyl-ACP methyl ester carboxylesterase
MWTYARPPAVLLVPALVLLLGSLSPHSVRAGTAPALPVFHQTACPLPLQTNQQAGVTVTCGYVVVPEDRTQPNGPAVSLATMVFKSTAANPDPVPFMYLQGGPGGVALLPFARGMFDDVLAAVLASRDLVVFDQRGTGSSLPSLACPELSNVEAAEPDVPIQDPEGLEPVATKSEQDARLQALAACRDRLTRGGVHLDAYNSVANAADVNDVRTALGYDKVNLYGVSYGTRLVQTVLQNYPDIVNSAIIDGVVPNGTDWKSAAPANAERAIRVMLADCARDPDCNALFPDPENHFFRLVDQLDSNPLMATLANPISGEQTVQPITGKNLLAVTFQSLYDRTHASLVPAVLAALEKGDVSPYEGLAAPGPFSGTNSLGMHYSIVCSEVAPYSSPDAAAAVAAPVRPEIVAAVSDEDMFSTCATWDVAAIPATQVQPVQSTIPTLVMSGEYDPVTPAAFAELVAKRLSNSYSFVFPGEGHGTLEVSPCPMSMAVAFMANPSAPPDPSCIASLSPPAFLPPAGG